MARLSTVFILFSLYLAGISATYDFDIRHPEFPRFNQWATHHSVIPESYDHFHHMFENWLDNDHYINTVNSLGLPYTLGHNVFSGMNFDEFREHMQFRYNEEYYTKHRSQSRYYDTFLAPILPNQVDWRAKGVVTPVKDQGQCGSCYSFSNTGALEGAYALRYGHLESFSEQQIVDCSLTSNGGINYGCDGGYIGETMDWISKYGGLCSESSYPYVSGTTQKAGTCHRCDLVNGSRIVSYTNVQQASDLAMMTALVNQPVSVAVEADQRSFQLYSSGVFTGSCGTNLDHAVLLVGYGTDSNGLDYYILKNSWGLSWGDKGYMYIGRGNDPKTGTPYNKGRGQCGVLMEGVFPTL